MCVALSNVLVYKSFFKIHMQTDGLRWLDCQASPKPVRGKSTTSLEQLFAKVSEDETMWDMTLVNHKNRRELLVFATFEGKMMAVDIRSGMFQWQASEYIPNKQYPLRAWSVTADDNGHLFVQDWNNDCIHLYSYDGKFVKTLLEEEAYDMEITRRIRWCEKSSSLIVVHSENERQQYYISIFSGLV